MFSLAVIVLWFGYAMVYTALANMSNGFQGPRLSDSFGLKIRVAPPGVQASGRRAGEGASQS